MMWKIATLAIIAVTLAISAPAADPEPSNAMPRYILQPEPVYPSEMRAQNIQGLVTVRVLIGRDGLPKAERIDKSSGYGPLDNAAIRAVRGAQWEPIPEPIWVRVPINFKLR